MLCVHLQMQTTDLCGVICLEKENNRRKISPAIQITQKAAYTWAGEGERKVERNCKLLYVTSLTKRRNKNMFKEQWKTGEIFKRFR